MPGLTVERNAYAAGFPIEVPASIPAGRVIESMKYKVRKGPAADNSCYDYSFGDWPEKYRWVSEAAASRCYILIPNGCEFHAHPFEAGKMVRTNSGPEPEIISIGQALARGIIVDVTSEIA